METTENATTPRYGPNPVTVY